MRYLCAPPRALERLHRNRTYYEAGLIGPDRQVLAVLAYDQKRTRRALLQAIYNHGPDIAALAGVDPDDCAVSWEAGSWRIGDGGFRVAWTGSTEFERASQALPLAA
jgi:hypothetical protein